MLDNLFLILSTFEYWLWTFFAVPAVLAVGFLLSARSRFAQIFHLPHLLRTFGGFLSVGKKNEDGIHPLKSFFNCVGGFTGIGNVVAICTAVQMGGPGALFWIWITALLGMILKYSEVFLGVHFRIYCPKGFARGGPMVFLQHVFKRTWVPKLVCILLCIYSVEVYQFSVMAQNISTNFHVSKDSVAMVLLVLVLFTCLGGIQRVGKISFMMIPLLFGTYLLMCIWVLAVNFTLIPEVFGTIITSAFTGHAAVGAFAGSSLMLTMSQGISRGCYAGDIGVGYSSVLHSESSETQPEKQALLSVVDIFIDSFVVCTTSIVLVLVTGVWNQPIDASILIQTALSQYFPFMELFMPIFLFFMGYTAINAYFCTGIRCAEYLSPKMGKWFYFGYGCLALPFFCTVESYKALMLISITGGILLLINLYGIYSLRRHIRF